MCCPIACLLEELDWYTERVISGNDDSKEILSSCLLGVQIKSQIKSLIALS